MLQYLKKLALPAFAAVIIASSCTESKTTSEEQTQIHTMDSTSKSVEESREKLEEQTKKVEESLERLDNEFDTTN